MAELIWPNKFTEKSIIQVKHDLLQGLFPIFSEYELDPNAFFKCIKCVLRIWEMPMGDAMLLFETLQDDIELADEALNEAGLSSMTSNEVIKLLKTRIEIAS